MQTYLLGIISQILFYKKGLQKSKKENSGERGPSSLSKKILAAIFSRIRNILITIVWNVQKYLLFVQMGNVNSRHKKIFVEPILKFSGFSYSLSTKNFLWVFVLMVIVSGNFRENQSLDYIFYTLFKKRLNLNSSRVFFCFLFDFSCMKLVRALRFAQHNRSTNFSRKLRNLITW